MGKNDTKPKRRRRAKKDPKKPKRPLSSYLYFCNERRGELQTSHPDKKLTEVASLLGAEWRSMGPDQKAGYQSKAVVDQSRYAKAMSSYVPPPTEVAA